MKFIFVFVFIFFSFNPQCSFAQESLAGVYSNKKLEDAGGVGTLLIHPVASASYFFSLKLNRGAPSYNSGHMFGKLLVKDSVAVYENDEFRVRGKGCKWTITFDDDVATIQTVDFENKCGFGNGVYADGQYLIESKEVPESYVDSLGNTVEFPSR